MDNRTLPPQLEHLDMNMLRQYFRDFPKGSSVSKQIKLIVVGKDGHAKSWVLNSLKENKTLGTKTIFTDPNDNNIWRVKNEKKNQDVTFSTWELGDQQVSQTKYDFIHIL